MEKYLPILENTRLFYGVGREEIKLLLGCLQASTRAYRKGEYVFTRGDTTENIVLLAEGSVYIQREDYWGNRSIVNAIVPGEMFAEAYAAGGDAISNDVVATEDSVVIYLNVNKMLTTCSSTCKFHTKVIRNLFFAISEKNKTLMQKLGYMSRRTTREKLMAYLSDQAKKQGMAEFAIPFNRQQLADFLSVDRSAMSGELCKMRDEGLIEFRKNKFKLM